MRNLSSRQYGLRRFRHTPLIALVSLMLPTMGCSTARHFGEAITGNNALSAGMTRIQSGDADQRREGIIWLVDHDYGRGPIYTAVYQQMASRDPDPLVRAMALRALNISRDASATPLFIGALNDPNPLIRLEGAKALYRLPDEAAVEPLLAIVRNEESGKDLRIASAEALQHYRRLDVGRALAALLNQRDFGLAWQARRTLKRLTGRELGYDENAWLQYLATPGNPLG